MQQGRPLKHCHQCNLDKDPEQDFYQKSGRPMAPCKECRKSSQLQRWHSQTSDEKARVAERHWEQLLPRQFNITVEDYWRMYAAQDGRCKICQRSLEDIASERFKHFAVDHDRRCCPGDTSCGRCVRGLLCLKCNGSLGWYEQFPSEIAAYLAVEGEVCSPVVP